MLIAVIAYKKIKAYEIGFKLAFIVASTVAVALGVCLYVTIKAPLGWIILFPLIFGPSFYGGLVFIAWASGETITREVWKEKLNSLDLFIKGYFLNTKIGESVLIGLSAGFGVLIIQILFLFAIQNFTAVTDTSYNSILSSMVNSLNNSISAISFAIYYPIFLVAIFFIICCFRY